MGFININKNNNQDNQAPKLEASIRQQGTGVTHNHKQHHRWPTKWSSAATNQKGSQVDQLQSCCYTNNTQTQVHKMNTTWSSTTYTSYCDGCKKPATHNVTWLCSGCGFPIQDPLMDNVLICRMLRCLLALKRLATTPTHCLATWRIKWTLHTWGRPNAIQAMPRKIHFLIPYRLFIGTYKHFVQWLSHMLWQAVTFLAVVVISFFC